MDLQLVWFCIVGVMFVAYFVLDGFDFGLQRILDGIEALLRR